VHFGTGNKFITPTIVERQGVRSATNGVAMFGLNPEVGVSPAPFFLATRMSSRQLRLSSRTRAATAACADRRALG